MSTTITLPFLRNIIEDGTPREEGTRLAEALLSRDDVDWTDLTVDLRDMPSELLNISFFYGFLQRIADTRAEVLERARAVKWTLSYPALETLVGAFMLKFQPRSPRKAA
jgi:hypothetical protein